MVRGRELGHLRWRRERREGGVCAAQISAPRHPRGFFIGVGKGGRQDSTFRHFLLDAGTTAPTAPRLVLGSKTPHGRARYTPVWQALRTAPRLVQLVNRDLPASWVQWLSKNADDFACTARKTVPFHKTVCASRGRCKAGIAVVERMNVIDAPRPSIVTHPPNHQVFP